MTLASPRRLVTHPLAALLALFVASRALGFAVGVRFSLFPLEWYWQYLPVDWLRHDLARGLYYMHDQPPLFNAYLGLVLKACPGHEALAFQVSYLALSLAFLATLYGLQRRLGVDRWIAAGLVACFMLAPATLLYENWLFYAYPTAALLAFGALALAGYLERRTFGRALAFFGVLAVLALTRSMYHLVWLGGIAAWLAWALPAERRRVLLAAVGPLLLVALWYAKNLLVFGMFSASSSVGMSFAKLSLGESRREQREAFHAAGLISDLAVVGPWRPLALYPPAYWQLPPTGISLLDAPLKPSGEPNFHHLAYVGIARQFGRDAVAVVRTHPEIYLKGVGKAFLTYLRPASEYMLLVENR
ncbi:MAG: hypothetical protein JWM80_750, partial [Cyanobacteria bacterium RYN_339]|nr:hypothetical protein [Cyanobacteria bacterium RYN_339]